MKEQTRKAIEAGNGSHAVFLALRHDEKLAGKYTASPSGTIYTGTTKAGKAEMASLLVYLTGRYGITPSEFELYSGVLAAVPQMDMVQDVRQVDEEFADRLRAKLRKRHIGISSADILSEVNESEELGLDWSGRAGEMKLATVMESLGWKRRRSMIQRVRRYRWYPPAGWEFAKDAEITVLDTSSPDDVEQAIGEDPWAEEEDIFFDDEEPVPEHLDDASHLQVVETTEE
tara:strand:- start:1640 stop:2329 length:690 start_codon:yes stop_codon:yes gene_type:complete